MLSKLGNRVWVMFRSGLDTMEIARRVSVEYKRKFSEAEVYNALAQMQEENYEGGLVWPLRRKEGERNAVGG